MAYRKKWDSFFEVLDDNHSGTITAEDGKLVAKKLTHAARIPEGSDLDKKLEKSTEEFIAGLIAFADANKDGKVTLAEFRTAYEKLVASGKDKLPEWYKQNNRVFFELADSNRNGELSEQEVVQAVKFINPGADEARLKAAYQNEFKAGHAKVDANATLDASWRYFSSAHETPELDLLFPAYRPSNK